MKSLSSFKPYLFTAYYNWLVDNGITPHLLLRTDVKGVIVPENYVRNNTIILNIAASAITNYAINARGITFRAAFRGVPKDVAVPFKAMQQLIAVETGGALPIGQALAAFDGADDEYDEEEDDKPIFSDASGADFDGADDLDRDDDDEDYDDPEAEPDDEEGEPDIPEDDDDDEEDDDDGGNTDGPGFSIVKDD